MDTIAEDGSHTVPVDLGSIAASIALASDALAAAADALAEAARAISDASGTPGNFNLPDKSSGIADPVNAPTRSDNKDELETNNKSGQANQHEVGDIQHKPEFECDVQVVSSPKSWISISSDSDSEVEFVPLDAPPDQPVPDHERPTHENNRDSPKPHDAPERGLNNTLDALPPSSVVSTSSEPMTVINQFVKSGRSGDPQSSISKLLGAMKSYPMIPWGRNYIRLEYPSDALAFLAYMALQANTVICLVSDLLMGTCSEMLPSLSDANIYRINTPPQFQTIRTALETLPDPSSSQIVLISSSMLELLSTTNIYPDTVLLHWGQPDNVDYWVRQTLMSLAPTMRVCVMVVGECYFNGSEHGLVPYPSTVMATCHDLNSPFQLLRQISSQLLLPQKQAMPKPPAPTEARGPKRLNLHPSRPSNTPAPTTALDWATDTLDWTTNALDWTTNADQLRINQSPRDIPPRTSGSQASDSRLLADMKSHPIIPSGRNYILLDQASDALAYIAYMALQFHRVACVVPTHLFGTCAELLKSLQNINVHRISKPRQPGQTSKTNVPKPADGVYLASCDNFSITWGRLEESDPDCILHWTWPASVYSITTRRMVDNFPLTIRACILVVGEGFYGEETHGVWPYPSSVLDACFRSDSPLQFLRQKASKLLPTLPTQSTSHTQTPKPAPKPRPSEPSSSWTINNLIYPSGSVVLLPTGHHYIILDQANDIDILSITAYIALSTKKVICHIPNDKVLATYHSIMNRIANIDVIAPALLKGKPFEATFKGFKSKTKGVWMRTISSEWNSFWSKSLVDCVIYWGIPPDLTYYHKECKLKVNTSYLVLTASQYSNIRSELNTKRRIVQHPHIRASDTSLPGTLLYDLRQKLTPLL